MADYTERFSEVWSLLDNDVISSASSEQNSGYVSLANYHRCMIQIIPVSLGSDIDVDIEQGTDTSGTGAKTFDSGNHDITVASTDTAPSIIEITTDELDVTNAFHCINVETTPTVASTYVVQIWGGVPRYAPVSTTNLDSVTD
jgi:hypothetical protein